MLFLKKLIKTIYTITPLSGDRRSEMIKDMILTRVAILKKSTAVENTVLCHNRANNDRVNIPL